MHRPDTCPTALGTPLDSILVHRLEVWRRRPASQAPGLCSFLAKFIMSQVDAPHTFVDFQCFGKGLWTKNDGKPCETWKILRTYQAICDTNIKPCPPPKIWTKITSGCQGEFPPKQDIVWYLYWNFSTTLQVSENLPPFHFSWLFWKDAQARHLSNSTWYTTWFHVTSLFRGLEPQTPVPNIRPLLLPCQCHCLPSRC